MRKKPFWHSYAPILRPGWQTGGFGGSVAYAASKGGIVSMTRGLARSLRILLSNQQTRAIMGEVAAEFVHGERDLPQAAARLGDILHRASA